MDTGLKEKIVVITGGSRGIGRSMVESFAAEGAVVHFTYSTSEGPSKEIVGSLEAKGQKARAHRVDVKDSTATSQMMQDIEADHGRIDVLINNAGIIRDTLVVAMERDDWQDVIATNLTGAYNCTKPAAKIMMRKRSGSIINISSVAATRPGRGHCNYAAAKGGLETMTKALAVELAPRKIRVNCIAPGMIETDMSQRVRDMAGDQILERILLKRFGTPRDIANAAMFLAGDLGSYITGTTLHVDGGVGA